MPCIRPCFFSSRWLWSFTGRSEWWQNWSWWARYYWLIWSSGFSLGGAGLEKKIGTQEQNRPKDQSLLHHPGKPTGILREKANFMMDDCVYYTHQEKKDAIRAGLQKCLRAGITAVQVKIVSIFSNACSWFWSSLSVQPLHRLQFVKHVWHTARKRGICVPRMVKNQM